KRHAPLPPWRSRAVLMMRAPRSPGVRTHGRIQATHEVRRQRRIRAQRLRDPFDKGPVVVLFEHATLPGNVTPTFTHAVRPPLVRTPSSSSRSRAQARFTRILSAEMPTPVSADI